MKKIGILTHYYNNQNLGGLLQAYALVQVLKKYHFDAEQISFVFQTYDGRSAPVRRQLLQNHLSIKKRVLILLHRLKAAWVRWKLRPYLSIQNKKISAFADEIAHSTQVYTDGNISAADMHYDAFVIGSDQVWNLDLLPHFAYYGEFVSSGKSVIAYAVSSGSKQFPALAEQLFIEKLARLNAISVREQTLKDYIERITDKKAAVVLDPTFLLSAQEWLAIANPAPVLQKPYIFCYFLGGQSAWQRHKAQAYADLYGYEVVHLPYITQYIRRSDSSLKGLGLWNIGPREFVTLINKAQCVFTDSFHGLAFSINLGKNFYVFNRDDKSGSDSMNARITDTLDTFGLRAQHITDKNAELDNKPLDFTQAHHILAQEKDKSINWLLNALKD